MIFGKSASSLRFTDLGIQNTAAQVALIGIRGVGIE